MKSIPLALFASLLGVVTSFAGGLGGPPFQNGSPLQSGIDGTYQASISGTNLTGIIRFSYSNGIQTGASSGNTWVAFLDGAIYRGTPDTTIGDNGSITGVLDASTSLGQNSDGGTDFPIVFVVSGSNTIGNFTATLDYKSPVGAFKGKGELVGTASTTNTIYVIASPNTNGIISSYEIPVVVNGRTIENSPFSVQGIRSSTADSGSLLNTNSTSN